MDEQKQMDPLTPEQKEYNRMSAAFNRMTRMYQDLKRRDLIPQCMPMSGEPDVDYVIEDIFYLYMNELKARHAGEKLIDK